MSTVSQNKNSVLWQQILANDVRFNAFRNFGSFKTLYLKRRNQLLCEVAKNGLHSFRKQYQTLRCQIFANKYQIAVDQISIRSKCSSQRSGHRLDDIEYQRFQRELLFPSGISIDRLVHPSFAFDSKPNEMEKNCSSESYAFTGMHHIFDQHTDAVTCVKFANNDKSLLACASLDKTLSICQLTPSPATVLYILRGHEAGVCDFEWSISNDLIVSCSIDSTTKLWDPANGVCLRTIEDPFKSPIFACKFQPNNNNMVVIGNEKGYIQILNVSTGIYTKGGVHIDGGKVLCLSFDPFGHVLWAGDSKGCLSSFIFEIKSGRLIKANKVLLVAGCPITSVSCCSWAADGTKEFSLLVNIACNSLIFFKVHGKTGQLEVKQRFSVKHQNNQLMIKSSYCPIISFNTGICVVSGSEDTCVYFFYAEAEDTKNKFINKLQGHSFPVLDVCFNYDESLLASSDSKGNVIVWKRETI